MGRVALQIERESAGSVAETGNVIFETLVLSAGGIDYDPTTGIITMNEPGRYFINWWVATQASVSGNGAVFTLSSSQGDLRAGNSPIKTGQVEGIALIDVSAVPATVSLVNTSLGTFYYSTIVPVKAALVVVQDSGVDAYGALLSDEGSMALTGTQTEIPMTLQSGASMNVDYSVPNALTISEAGVYRVEILLPGVTLATANVELALGINGTESGDMAQTLEFTSVNTTTFALTNFLTLAAGTILTLLLSSTPGTTFFFPPFGPGATLSIEKLS